MASLVDHASANLTLVSLLPYDTPDEISAVGAVGGLSKVGGHELVAVDLVDSAPDRPLPLPGPHALPEHAFFIVFRGFALQPLPQEAPEQGATVVAEGGDLVVVDPELVGHVDAEPLGAHLVGSFLFL